MKVFFGEFYEKRCIKSILERSGYDAGMRDPYMHQDCSIRSRYADNMMRKNIKDGIG